MLIFHRLVKAGQCIEAPFSVRCVIVVSAVVSLLSLLQATASNFNYTDTGLFAITMVTHGDNMAGVRDHLMLMML